MSEWKEYGLNEIASFSQGKQIPVSEQFENKLLELDRFIRIVDFTSDWTQPPRYVKKDDKYKVGKNDIVMLRYGTPGKVFRGHEGIIANNMFKISPDESIVTKEYLYWFLYQDSVYKILMANQSSSTMPAISFKMLSCINVKVPSFETQQHISSFFDTLDEKIAVNKKICENLEAQAQALFKHWFIDFAPFKDGKFVESELGLIPEGWKISNIYEYIDVIYGAPYKSSLFNDKKNGLPLIRIRDLKTYSPQFYTPEILPTTEYIEAGDVVAGMDAEFIPYLWLGEKGVLNQRCCKFKGKDNRISNYYILFLVKPELEYVQSYKTGTTVSHLGKSDIDRFRFVTPPLDVILSFSDMVNSMKEEVVTRAKESSRLATLRDTLLPKLMSGQIKLSEYE